MTKVLVVDDEPAILDMLAIVLKDAGYAVVVADNGPRALELLSREPPDVILLDLMMPGMDGREVCRRLRVMPGLESLPVVVITAGLMPDLTGCATAAFIPKPFDIDGLVATLTQIIRP